MIRIEFLFSTLDLAVWHHQPSPSRCSLFRTPLRLWPSSVSVCPFLSFPPFPTPACPRSFHLPSIHSGLCTSYQHVSLSASRCLRQAFLSRKLLQLQSCLLSSIRLFVPQSHSFVLFNATINLLANMQQSRRLGVGIKFLALWPPKNAGAWN